MSHKTPEQVCTPSGNTVCRIDSHVERMHAVAESAGTPCACEAPSPDVEIELLDQHGIEGIHIYCK